MEHDSSAGASWADQWDYSDWSPRSQSKTGGGGGYYNNNSNSKNKKKIVVEKTKAVASTGLKKAKEGANHGLQWIKDKYNKRTQKQ